MSFRTEATGEGSEAFSVSELRPAGDAFDGIKKQSSMLSIYQQQVISYCYCHTNEDDAWIGAQRSVVSAVLFTCLCRGSLGTTAARPRHSSSTLRRRTGSARRRRITARRHRIVSLLVVDAG